MLDKLKQEAMRRGMKLMTNPKVMKAMARHQREVFWAIDSVTGILPQSREAIRDPPAEGRGSRGRLCTWCADSRDDSGWGARRGGVTAVGRYGEGLCLLGRQ